MSKDNNSNNGVGFLGLLGVAFIILKLCDVIDWSWWYVLLPLYGGIVIGLIALCLMIMIRVITTNNHESLRPTNNMNKSAFADKLEKRMNEARDGQRKKINK